MRDLVLGSTIAPRQVVYIPRDLRFRHAYVLGKTGKGKTTLLHRLIQQDAKEPYATVVFDAGNLAAKVFEGLPKKVMNRVWWFSVQHPIPYNPFARQRKEPERLHNELCALIDQVTAELSSTPPLSARMKRLLAVAIDEVAKQPDPTFSTLATLLLERKTALRTALQLREDEFSATWEGVIDRLSQFLRDRRIRRVICTPHKLDFGRVIDERKILLVSLTGLEPALQRFLGTLLFQGLQATIFERSESKRRPVVCYVDEFQDYLASSYAVTHFQKFFAQGRGYQFGLTVAHQDFGTVPDHLLRTIHGNAGALITFSCGGREAIAMSREFANQWPPEAISLLPDYHVIARIGEDIHYLETYPPLGKERDMVEEERVHNDPPDPFKVTLGTDERRDPYTAAHKPRPTKAPAKT